MTRAFDPRIVPPARVELVRAFEAASSCRLAGGAALSGLHLRHRLSRDVDLFFADSTSLRDAVRTLPDLARAGSASLRVVRDAGTHVRIEAPERTSEGIVVDSWMDLRAAKLACLLERSEPRDLVDVMFLERAGFPAEADLPAAARKDAGVDPAALAWLLHTFPTEPLPDMLVALTADELKQYRDALAERFRRLATPS